MMATKPGPFPLSERMTPLVNKTVAALPDDDQSLDLRDAYDQFFSAIPARTETQIADSQRLRFQVYCRENAYEDPAKNPGERETDSWDAFAVHSLLLHRPTNAVAGTVRLILPAAVDAGLGLPIAHVSTNPLDRADCPLLPCGATAEISRLAVSKEFRKRVSDQKPAAGGIGAESHSWQHRRRLIPHISLGLMQAIVAMSAENGITHLVAVMEPALLRLLVRLGIHFNNLGPLVDYHGKRQPCFADLDNLLTHTWLKRRDIWQVLTRNGSLWPLNQRLRAEMEVLEHHV